MPGGTKPLPELMLTRHQCIRMKLDNSHERNAQYDQNIDRHNMLSVRGLLDNVITLMVNDEHTLSSTAQMELPLFSLLLPLIMTMMNYHNNIVVISAFIDVAVQSAVIDGCFKSFNFTSRGASQYEDVVLLVW